MVNCYRNAHAHQTAMYCNEWQAETKSCPITHSCEITLHIYSSVAVQKRMYLRRFCIYEYWMPNAILVLFTIPYVCVNVKMISLVIRAHTNLRISELLACVRAQMKNRFVFSLPTSFDFPFWRCQILYMYEFNHVQSDFVTVNWMKPTAW